MHYKAYKVVKDTRRRFYRLRSIVERLHPYTVNGIPQMERTFHNVLTVGPLTIEYKRHPTVAYDNVTRTIGFQVLLPEAFAALLKLSGPFVWFKVDTGASI